MDTLSKNKYPTEKEKDILCATIDSCINLVFFANEELSVKSILKHLIKHPCKDFESYKIVDFFLKYKLYLIKGIRKGLLNYIFRPIDSNPDVSVIIKTGRSSNALSFCIINNS